VSEKLQPDPSSAATSSSPWAPLFNPIFRKLWIVWFIANACLWMNDVAAAWLMTTLTTSPVMVALVQTASTLPVFLLGLPSGALADIVDRRRYFVVTQFWVAGSGLLLYLAIASGAINATLLLVLVFFNGVGLAMRWPVYSAIVPELVPRSQLPQALALNGVAMNASRILGPIIAGLIIASFGSAPVFALNAVLSILAGLTILTWRREKKPSTLPGERFLGAIRVGVQYVRQSARMKTVLLRVAIFFAQSTALIALLPLIAQQMPNGTARTYTVLLASMGAGAIVSALFIPSWQRKHTSDLIVRVGSWTQALSMILVAFAPNVWVAVPGMVISGIAWLTVANTLSVAAQLSLPNWVRARAMSTYQMAIMGGSAFGAATWGQVASLTDVRTGVVLAAIAGTIVLWLTRGRGLQDSPEEDFSQQYRVPAPKPAWRFDRYAGPVLTTIEYRVDPARADEFRQVMQIVGRRRLSRGALSWELFRDTADPGRFVEYMLDESWLEHLRHFDRLTATDEALRNRRLAFHIGDEPPVVTRAIAASARRRNPPTTRDAGGVPATPH
jgi:MFS family permease